MLFKSELGLVVNIYHTLGQPLSRKITKSYMLRKEKNGIILTAQLTPQKAKTDWKINI